MALLKSVAARRERETVMIHSPVKSSKSNGRMERSVRKWQDQLRTLKHFVESRIKCKIPPESALFSWLVTFAAEIISKFQVEDYGKTSYEEITGHRFKHFVVGFAETVHFKLETEKSNRHKSDTDWNTGVFLGYVWNSTEYIVGTKEAIFKCRTIRRLPDEQAYDVKVLEVVTIPYVEYVSSGATSTHIGVRFTDQPDINIDTAPTPAKGGNEGPRRTRLLQADFLKHGYTVECPGCQCIEEGLGDRRGHTVQCRERMEEAMKDDEEAAVRLERTKRRHDHYVAKQGEAIIAEEREEDPRQEEDILVNAPGVKSDTVRVEQAEEQEK